MARKLRASRGILIIYVVQNGRRDVYIQFRFFKFMWYTYPKICSSSQYCELTSMTSQYTMYMKCSGIYTHINNNTYSYSKKDVLIVTQDFYLLNE